MTSAPVDLAHLLDAALVVALLATTGYAIALRREFRRFKTYSADYAAALERTGRAVEDVGRAVDSVQREGAGVLAALGERIEEARAVAARLEGAGRAALGAQPAAAPAQPPAPREETPAPFRPRPDQKPKAYSWPTVVVKRLSDDA